MASTGVSKTTLAATALVAAVGGAVLGAAWTRGTAPVTVAAAPAVAAEAAPGPLPMQSAASSPWSAPGEPASREALMQRYATELDEDTRGALLAELQRSPDDALRDFALDLVAAGDADTRLRGYELLAAFTLEDGAVRGAVLSGLAGERAPRVLARVATLTVPTVLPASEAAPVANALAELAGHRDPAVRAQGVVQAAQWAAPGEAGPLLARALLDESAEVRKAAVAGTIATRASSPQIKDALLWIAGDDEADPEQRTAAVFALQWYRLDDAEYAIYREAESASGHAH